MERVKPHSIYAQDFRLMVEHRIWASLVLGSHILRSLWPERSIDQSVIDLRWEIARAEAVILKSSQELERCIASTWFYSDLVKVIGLLVVQLIIVFGLWVWYIRRKAPVVEDTDSETDTSPVGAIVESTLLGTKLQSDSVVVERGIDRNRTGPLRPSDLRRLVRDGGGTTRSTNFGSP